MEVSMKAIGVVTDSHSGITQEEAEKLGIMVLPAPFYIDGECYYEGINLSRETLFERIKAGAKVSTSQPSPEELMKFWDKALEQFEKIIYIPISSGLSGSCQSAMMFSREDEYEGKVFVVDNGRVATPQHRSVLDALELIEEGYFPEWIKQMLEDDRANMNIYVAVESLDNLKAGGRISATTAALGNMLNIKPVLKFDVGTLDTFQKCRGFNKAKKVMLEAMKHDMETQFKEYVDKGEFYLLAASSADKEATDEWIAEIEAYFPGMKVMCDDLAMAVSCHIGVGGLGIGCSCKPTRI